MSWPSAEPARKNQLSAPSGLGGFRTLAGARSGDKVALIADLPAFPLERVSSTTNPSVGYQTSDFIH
jgi:hypothetical protein